MTYALISYLLLIHQLSFKLNATGQRWVYELVNFQFSVNYKTGIQNKVPDSLSRFPKSKPNPEECHKNYSVKKVQAIFDGSINQTTGKETRVPLINQIIPEKKGVEDQLLHYASDKTI